MAKQFNYCSAGSHAAGLMLEFFGTRAVNKKENMAKRQLCIDKIVLVLKEFDDYAKGNTKPVEQKREVSEVVEELPF